MKIICLGWGSLIWDSRDLGKEESDWQTDGPSLPIEFTRISNNGRVTLIIDEEADLVPVLWCHLDQNDLGEAITLLSQREGTLEKKISRIEVSQLPSGRTEKSIVTWLKSKGFDAAIWTGLSYKTVTRPSVEDIVRHLKSLDDVSQQRAREYVERAPAQIDTPYRRHIKDVFGWE